MSILQLAFHSLLFIVGIILLIIAGDTLVKNASKLARSFGINPLIIGLTVVAFGTSMPEFLVCLVAAIQESSDIVTGNIIGSNIANIGLILGIAASFRPLVSERTVLRVEIPVMLAMSVFLYLLSLNLILSRIEGLFLFSLLIGFIIHNYINAQRGLEIPLDEEGKQIHPDKKDAIKKIFYIAVGVIGLFLGANLVVDNATIIARSIGVSELVIAITAVAIGTSLPELSASLVAAYRGESAILVGNIIGSNIFNIGILGLVSLIYPVNVNQSLINLEYPYMLILSAATLPMMKTNKTVSRKEGLLFLLIYLSFLLLLFNR